MTDEIRYTRAHEAWREPSCIGTLLCYYDLELDVNRLRQRLRQRALETLQSTPKIDSASMCSVVHNANSEQQFGLTSFHPVPPPTVITRNQPPAICSNPSLATLALATPIDLAQRAQHKGWLSHASRCNQRIAAPGLSRAIDKIGSAQHKRLSRPASMIDRCLMLVFFSLSYYCQVAVAVRVWILRGHRLPRGRRVIEANVECDINASKAHSAVKKHNCLTA